MRRYTIGEPPRPALLDVASVRRDGILLLDTFFHVIVFHGEDVATWRDQGCARARSMRVCTSRMGAAFDICISRIGAALDMCSGA